MTLPTEAELHALEEYLYRRERSGIDKAVRVIAHDRCRVPYCRFTKERDGQCWKHYMEARKARPVAQTVAMRGGLGSTAAPAGNAGATSATSSPAAGSDAPTEPPATQNQQRIDGG